MAGPGYVEAEENKYIKYFCLVSKIVVVVLHGHICVINEIWLYKPNLKSFGHLSKRWEGVAIKTKEKLLFNFGQEYLEGGGKVGLSKINKNVKNMVKGSVCLLKEP